MDKVLLAFQKEKSQIPSAPKSFIAYNYDGHSNEEMTKLALYATKCVHDTGAVTVRYSAVIGSTIVSLTLG